MKTELYGRRTYLWGLTQLWTTCPCRHHSHAALAMRTEANLPSFLLAYLHVGFLRAHLNPYLTLLVLALWTVAVTAAVVADMYLTGLKQMGHTNDAGSDWQATYPDLPLQDLPSEMLELSLRRHRLTAEHTL
jgi:hypothetical protein